VFGTDQLSHDGHVGDKKSLKKDQKIYYTNSVTHHKQLLAIILKGNRTLQTEIKVEVRNQ